MTKKLRAKKQLRDALRISEPGSRDVPGVIMLGPTKFRNAEPPNAGWMTGAFGDKFLSKGDVFGAYTGLETISDMPRCRFNANGAADPCYLLHVPLKTRTKKRGKTSVRTQGHLYIDAGNPQTSGWCRYINTHAGTRSVCVVFNRLEPYTSFVSPDRLLENQLCVHIDRRRGVCASHSRYTAWRTTVFEVRTLMNNYSLCSVSSQ
jgi:hypothetical protein